MDPLEVIFVGDLSYFCARQDLLDLFSQFGPVSSAVVRKSKSNEPLHYGFVELPSSCARRAVDALQGTYYLGRKMRVSIEKGNNPDYHNKLVSIHVSFLTQMTSFVVNEVYLSQVFAPFGKLVDCVVKQHSLSIDPPKQCGYGFLYFADMDSAHSVLQALATEPNLNGIKYDCKLSNALPVDASRKENHLRQAKQQQQQQLQFQQQQLHHFQNQPQGTMLPQMSLYGQQSFPPQLPTGPGQVSMFPQQHMMPMFQAQQHTNYLPINSGSSATIGTFHMPPQPQTLSYAPPPSMLLPTYTSNAAPLAYTASNNMDKYNTNSPTLSNATFFPPNNQGNFLIRNNSGNNMVNNTASLSSSSPPGNSHSPPTASPIYLPLNQQSQPQQSFMNPNYSVNHANAQNNNSPLMMGISYNSSPNNMMLDQRKYINNYR